MELGGEPVRHVEHADLLRALSSFVSIFPQVVWLSEHKEGLFLFAGLAMAGAGWLQLMPH